MKSVFNSIENVRHELCQIWKTTFWIQVKEETFDPIRNKITNPIRDEVMDYIDDQIEGYV